MDSPPPPAPPVLGPSLGRLLSELVDGARDTGGFVLNRSDPGLLRSLARIPWERANDVSADGAPVAAHVDHVWYGLSLMNRFARGEPNPFEDADWSGSWEVTVASREEWDALRQKLTDEARRWISTLEGLGDGSGLPKVAYLGVIGSVAHVAYHLGAIRQIAMETRGPKETEV